METINLCISVFWKKYLTNLMLELLKQLQCDHVCLPVDSGNSLPWEWYNVLWLDQSECRSTDEEQTDTPV